MEYRNADTEIRQAGTEDLNILMEWRMRVLREVFGMQDSEETDEEIAELFEKNRLYYLSEIPRGGHKACFAYRGDKAVGCGGICIYHEMPSPDNRSGICGYLMNIYTLPEFRGQGIGRKVVGWLIDRAEEEGAGKIYLETSESGEKLYKDMGFREMRDFLILA